MPTVEPLNTIPLQQFIQLAKSAENSRAKEVKPKDVTQVGLRLMKFCAKWDMQRIADNASQYSEPLSARYPQ